MTNSGERCPFQAILQVRENEVNEKEYLVKYFGRKYADSEWIPRSELTKWHESKTLVSRYTKRARHESFETYDPAYDIVDKVIFSDPEKGFLTLWSKLGFEDPTWETDVNEAAISLFQSRSAAGFPNRCDDYLAPAKDIQFIRRFEDLTVREVATVNRFIGGYIKGMDVVVTDSMNFSSVKAGVAFLRALQHAGDHGPFLVVTDDRHGWMRYLQPCSDVLGIAYEGNDEAKSNLNSLYFENESDTVQFNVMVVSPSVLQKEAAVLSKINYRLAIINVTNAKHTYKNFTCVNIGRYVCIAHEDAGYCARELAEITDVCARDENAEFVESESFTSAKNALECLQPVIQRIQMHGNPQFVSPPIQTIDCPLSPIQKSVCRSVLSKYRDNQRVAAEKVIRVCSHAFGLEGVEFGLQSPDFVEASTKLKVLKELLEICRNNAWNVLIIAKYVTNVDLISDLLSTEKIEYYDYSSIYQEQRGDPKETEMVSIYNPTFGSKLPVHVELVNCVIIFDGAISAWRDLVTTHRHSRIPAFHVSEIYNLECRDCCERELIALCDASTFREDKVEMALKAAAVHAFSSFNNDNIAELIESRTVCDENMFSQPIHSALNGLESSAGIWDIVSSYSMDWNTSTPVKLESHQWTPRQRNQCIRGLLRFGFHNMAAIQKTEGLYLHQDTIHQAVRAVVRDWIKAVASSGYNIAREFVGDEKAEDDEEFMTNTCFNSEFMNDVLHPIAGTLLKRVEFLFYMHRALDDVAHDLTQIPTFRLGGTLFTDWWTDDYDKALAYATWRFGFGVFDHIRATANNELCKLLANMPEVVDGRRLSERALKICEISKRAQISDEKIVEFFGDRESNWPREEQMRVVETLIRFGIKLTGDPEARDYEWFRAKTGITSHGVDEVQEYVEGLLEQCNNPDSGNGITYNMAARVTQRVGAMMQLRKVLQSEKYTEIFSNAPHWRNMTKKWSPELEIEYFCALEERGFGKAEDGTHFYDILETEEFASVFENKEPPAFLKVDEDIVKRIGVVYNYMVNPSGSKSSKSSSKKKKDGGAAHAPAKKIDVATVKRMKGDIEFPLFVTPASAILDVGTIVTDREGFHTNRYIYPAGYKIMKQYASLTNVDDRAWWISEIVDTGKKEPVFRVYEQDNPGETTFEGPTPSAPWVCVLKAISAKKKEKKANTISGPEAYLLAHPVSAYLIQNLPGARECKKYTWRETEGE